MNQILEYDNSRKNSSGNGSDKVIKIFAVILIVVAVILICVALKERKNNEDINKAETPKSSATIDIEIDEERSKAIISVKNDKKIEKMVYSWENGKENTIPGDSTTMNEEIDVPAGDDVLHIKIIDEDGNETVESQETHLSSGIDIKNPVIDLEVTTEAKLKITATDETELSFITYRWNDEEEQRIDVSEDDKKKIETEIEILKGENDLTVIAVDSSNNTTREGQSFIGRTKPSISVVLSPEGDVANINIEDDYGIDTIKLNFNDQDYDVEFDHENNMSASFSLNLENGDNRIILTVTNTYGISNTFDGNCTYGNVTDEQEENESEEETENSDDENEAEEESEASE